MKNRTQSPIAPERRGLALALTLTGFAGLVLPLAAQAQFAGTPTLINVSTTGEYGNANARSVSMSADGSIIAFASDADNLVPLDQNEDSDVFVRDTRTGVTTRVSVTFQGGEAMGDSYCPSISGDGRWVAFRSVAWNIYESGGNVGTPASDVYLHDRNGPSLIRVTQPIEGGYSTLDSWCPSISADGTHVAFASDAPLIEEDVNEYRDIYVYEVATGELTIASLADDESLSDASSDAPSISADGSTVAFESTSRTLTAGSFAFWPIPQVFVRDRSAGTTELISVAGLPPLDTPVSRSIDPHISADGNSVLFRSKATNLVPGTEPPNSWTRSPWRVYLRDRAAGVTESIDLLSSDDLSCGFTDRLCDRSDTDAIALSGDARFVAYLNGSFNLLPENDVDLPAFLLPSHVLQIYILDRQTLRLRRVSVDPTGFAAHAHPCGGTSSRLALSADGTALAFVGEDSRFMGLRERETIDGPDDVVRLEWTCDREDGRCRQLSTCPDLPAETCEVARHSRLHIRRNPPLADRRERFRWQWRGPGGAPSEGFAGPGEEGYQLCLYAGNVLRTQIDAGLLPGDEWREIAGGWKRNAPDDAVQITRLRRNSNRTSIRVRSSSPALDLPYLPLRTGEGIIVQLHESSTGRCWGADFTPDTVLTNRRGEIRATDVVSGYVRARY